MTTGYQAITQGQTHKKSNLFGVPRSRGVFVDAVVVENGCKVRLLILVENGMALFSRSTGIFPNTKSF
jgi:hypothetical protein